MANHAAVGGIEDAGSRFAFLKGFLAAAVFVAMVLSFLPVRYESNDDFALIAQLSSRSGFSPDPIQPALSFTLGRILHALYGHWPHVPWHGLFVYLAAFFGMSLVLSVFFRFAQGISLILALPLLGVVYLHVFSFISFTAASLVLETGVLLCVMEWAVRGRCPARNARLYAVVLCAGFLIGFLLRWRLVLFSLAFGAPLLLFLKRGQVRRAMPAVLLLALFVLGDRALFHHASSEEHKAYWEYNRLRARFHDTALGQDYGEATRKALGKAGWSPEDYAFYRNWIVYDNRRFNTETLRTFLQENDPKREESLLVLARNELQGHFRDGKRYLLASLFAISSLLAVRYRTLWALAGRDRLKILLALACVGAGIVCVVSIRSVERVYIPLYGYFFGLCFLLFHVKKGPSAKGASRTAERTVAVLCALVFSILAWGQAHAQAKAGIHRLERSKAKKEYVLERLKKVKERRAGSRTLLILMNPSSGLSQEAIHPLKEFNEFTDLKVFPAGWSVNSPRYASILRDIGLQEGWAFLGWTVDREEALLLLTASSEIDVWRYRAAWEGYLSRRILGNRRVKLVPVHDFRDEKGAGLVLFRARSVR